MKSVLRMGIKLALSVTKKFLLSRKNILEGRNFFSLLFGRRFYAMMLTCSFKEL